MVGIATKEQERKALEQIKRIVEVLGEDSYIGMAFEGCFEMAETNIENDWGCSWKQKAEANYEKMLEENGKKCVLETKCKILASEAKDFKAHENDLERKIADLEAENAKLREQLKKGIQIVTSDAEKRRTG